LKEEEEAQRKFKQEQREKQKQILMEEQERQQEEAKKHTITLGTRRSLELPRKESKKDDLTIKKDYLNLSTRQPKIKDKKSFFDPSNGLKKLKGMGNKVLSVPHSMNIHISGKKKREQPVNQPTIPNEAINMVVVDDLLDDLGAKLLEEPGSPPDGKIMITHQERELLDALVQTQTKEKPLQYAQLNEKMIKLKEKLMGQNEKMVNLAHKYEHNSMILDAEQSVINLKLENSSFSKKIEKISNMNKELRELLDPIRVKTELAQNNFSDTIDQTQLLEMNIDEFQRSLPMKYTHRTFLTISLMFLFLSYLIISIFY